MLTLVMPHVAFSDASSSSGQSAFSTMARHSEGAPLVEQYPVVAASSSGRSSRVFIR